MHMVYSPNQFTKSVLKGVTMVLVLWVKIWLRNNDQAFSGGQNKTKVYCQTLEK